MKSASSSSSSSQNYVKRRCCGCLIKHAPGPCDCAWKKKKGKKHTAVEPTQGTQLQQSQEKRPQTSPASLKSNQDRRISIARGQELCWHRCPYLGGPRSHHGRAWGGRGSWRSCRWHLWLLGDECERFGASSARGKGRKGCCTEGKTFFSCNSCFWRKDEPC